MEIKGRDSELMMRQEGYNGENSHMPLGTFQESDLAVGGSLVDDDKDLSNKLERVFRDMVIISAFIASGYDIHALARRVRRKLRRTFARRGMSNDDIADAILASCQGKNVAIPNRDVLCAGLLALDILGYMRKEKG